MNKRKIALGPGAASLILIVVVLSLCMRAMLAQIGSRNDVSLSSRSAEMITRVYELRDQSEHRMAELDAILVRCQAEAKDKAAYLAEVAKNLPEDMTMGEWFKWFANLHANPGEARRFLRLMRQHIPNWRYRIKGNIDQAMEMAMHQRITKDIYLMHRSQQRQTLALHHQTAYLPVGLVVEIMLMQVLHLI